MKGWVDEWRDGGWVDTLISSLFFPDIPRCLKYWVLRVLSYQFGARHFGSRPK